MSPAIRALRHLFAPFLNLGNREVSVNREGFSACVKFRVSDLIGYSLHYNRFHISKCYFVFNATEA